MPVFTPLSPAEQQAFIRDGLIPDHLLDDDGALHYLPDGHHRMACWFAGERTDTTVGQAPADIEAEGGVALLGEVGDVVFVHHLVPYRVCANTSDRPQIMAYFRLTHTDHDQLVTSALRDPWAEYPHLGALAAASRA